VIAQLSKGAVNHGLFFLALLSFMVSFLVARTFTTINPHAVVVTGGIHFHHFWYGLGMVVVAGWLGIVSSIPTHRRIYALVFGFGGGLIGDEIGLLLTLGDYYSTLTYVFMMGFIGGATIVLLLIRYRERLEHDVLRLGIGERLVHIGVVIAALSALPFSFDAAPLGSATLVTGALIVAVGVVAHRKRAPDG
jgi:hypothetical protein